MLTTGEVTQTQHIDKVVEMPDVKVPQIQYRDKVIDVLVVLRRQEPTIQTGEKRRWRFGCQCLHCGADVMVPQSSQTEVMKKIRETGRGHGENRSDSS